MDEKLALLHKYSACDVSDALLKLEKVPAGSIPRAGYLADIVPFAPHTDRYNEQQQKVIAPASTFKFISKCEHPEARPDLELALSDPEHHGFPTGKHWVDHCEPGTIAVVDQAPGQRCAVLGGVMAARMKQLGVKGVVVNGRVRDLAELRGSKLPVWARFTSTVGTGAEAKPGVRNVPVSIGGVIVSPGDVIFCDPVEGVVAIPKNLLDAVLELMPKLATMDDKVKEAVTKGMSVHEAFQKFRS